MLKIHDVVPMTADHCLVWHHDLCCLCYTIDCNVHADMHVFMHLFICVVIHQCNIVPARGLLSTISKSLALPGQVAGCPNAIHEVPSTVLLTLTRQYHRCCQHASLRFASWHTPSIHEPTQSCLGL